MTTQDQIAAGRTIREGARVAGISLRLIAREVGIPYVRLLRLIVGERRVKPGEFERVQAIVLHGLEARR